MQLNSFLFPAPQVGYTPQDLDGEMVYIPHYFKFNKRFRAEIKEVGLRNSGFQRKIPETEQTNQTLGGGNNQKVTVSTEHDQLDATMIQTPQLEISGSIKRST